MRLEYKVRGKTYSEIQAQAKKVLEKFLDGVGMDVQMSFHVEPIGEVTRMSDPAPVFLEWEAEVVVKTP